MLAILKAGGAYVPLDPNYPKARLEYMLAETASPIILSENHVLVELPFLNVQKTLPIDGEMRELYLQLSAKWNVHLT